MDTTSVDNLSNPFVNPLCTENSIQQHLNEAESNSHLHTTTIEELKKSNENLLASTDFYHNGVTREESKYNNSKKDDHVVSDTTDTVDFVPDNAMDSLSNAMMSSLLIDEDANNECRKNDVIMNSSNTQSIFNPFIEMDSETKSKDLCGSSVSQSICSVDVLSMIEPAAESTNIVHDEGLIEQVGDSGDESADDWNYFAGADTNKENVSPSQLIVDTEVEQLTEGLDNMSQLNPNAAEFVPASTSERSTPSFNCRSIANDEVISQSPKRASDIDIALPKPQEFASEVKSRPSDLFGEVNDNIEIDNSLQNTPENYRNGDCERKVVSPQGDDNIDTPNTSMELPSFTDALSPSSDIIDVSKPTSNVTQNEDTTSQNTNDESDNHLIIDMNRVEDNTEKTDKINADPMTMSFYDMDNQGIDLNSVQVLPDNIDDFLNKMSEQNTSETNSKVAFENMSPNDAVTDKCQLSDEKEQASPTSDNDVDDNVLDQYVIGPTEHTDHHIEMKFTDLNSGNSMVSTSLIPNDQNTNLVDNVAISGINGSDPETIICKVGALQSQQEQISAVLDLIGNGVDQNVDNTEVCNFFVKQPVEEESMIDKDLPIGSNQSSAVQPTEYVDTMNSEHTSPPTDTESVTTTDINSFLNRTDLTAVTSPLSSGNSQDQSIVDNEADKTAIMKIPLLSDEEVIMICEPTVNSVNGIENKSSSDIVAKSKVATKKPLTTKSPVVGVSKVKSASTNVSTVSKLKPVMKSSPSSVKTTKNELVRPILQNPRIIEKKPSTATNTTKMRQTLVKPSLKLSGQQRPASTIPTSNSVKSTVNSVSSRTSTTKAESSSTTASNLKTRPKIGSTSTGITGMSTKVRPSTAPVLTKTKVQPKVTSKIDSHIDKNMKEKSNKMLTNTSTVKSNILSKKVADNNASAMKKPEKPKVTGSRPIPSKASTTATTQIKSQGLRNTTVKQKVTKASTTVKTNGIVNQKSSTVTTNQTNADEILYSMNSTLKMT